jgi:hypothetical protein
MKCESCRNKNSDKRCSRKALKNLRFCGIHSKTKHKRVWTEIHKIDIKIIKVQALFRAWILRDTLKLCGPGVLSNKYRHNEEDLVTADKVHPLDYFAIRESDKIFWFDVRTIYQWCSQNLEPTNPYTKVPLTIDDRKRLRRLCARREFFNKPVYHDPLYFKNCDQVKFLLYQIIQILNENLFAEITEPYFFELTEFQFLDFSREIKFLAEHWKNKKNALNIYYKWLEYTNILLNHNFLAGFIPFLVTILGILKNHKIQYEFSFIVLSARSNLI